MSKMSLLNLPNEIIRIIFDPLWVGYCQIILARRSCKRIRRVLQIPTCSSIMVLLYADQDSCPDIFQKAWEFNKVPIHCNKLDKYALYHQQGPRLYERSWYEYWWSKHRYIEKVSGNLNIFIAAIKQDDIAFVIWVLKNIKNMPINKTNCIRMASTNRFTSMLSVLIRNSDFSDFNFEVSACIAAKCGNLNVLEWAFDRFKKRYPVRQSGWTVSYEWEYGHQQHGCHNFPIRMCVKYAIQNNHLHILDWLFNTFGKLVSYYRVISYAKNIVPESQKIQDWADDNLKQFVKVSQYPRTAHRLDHSWYRMA